MISRREFLRVSAVAAAGAALTACGPAATEAPKEEMGGETTGGEEKMEEKAMPERDKSWPPPAPPRNRTLNYYWQAAPSAGLFNAYASGYNHQNGNACLTEPCAYYGVHADKSYPWLAESYSYNAEATELTINFRKGIKWSDGTPFTAEDVAWSMDTLKRVDGLNRSGNVRATIDKAEAVDDTTLKLTFSQTDWRFFFTSLTFRFDLGDDTAVQPKHVWSAIPDADIATTVYFDVAKGWPVTTGPYGVSESNEQYTNYDLLPSWWAVETGFVAEEPAPWRIQQTLFANDQLAAQLLINKEIDQSLDLRPFVVASTLAQADHLDTWTGRKPPYGYVDWWPISVQMQATKYPTDDKRVRWAVAYALDQQKIVDIGWSGAGTPAYAPFPDYPKLVALLDQIKDVTDKYNVMEFNLEKSAALMEEAGFTKDAEGFWVDADGVRPDMDVYAAVPLFGDIAPIVAEQLRTAGFNCQHKNPPDVWTAKGDGRATLHLFGHGGATIDPFDTFQLYRKSDVVPLGTGVGLNRTRWSNDDFEAIAEEMRHTPMDDPKMVDLFRRGMEIWFEELPDCPIVQWYHRIPISNWYFTDWPNEQDPYMNSALWHFTMIQVILGLKATGNA
jgi:peptide/nickel transport system substrate-binding protein